MSEIQMSAEALTAFAKEVVRQTLKELRKNSVTKSEYARLNNVSRVTVDRMIERGELKLNTHGKVIVDFNI